MKVAVVHSHLRRGGVTRVIETALAGLEAAGAAVETAVLAGEAPAAYSPAAARFRLVEGLGYRAAATPSESEALAGLLRARAREIFGGSPDLWHFHNHSLGKNVGIPAILGNLLEGGARLLLQIHDFAEDGRPELYARQTVFSPAASWYPVAPQIHYAALNLRDAGFLRGSGLPAPQLHLLPNAVSAPPVGDGAGGAGRFTSRGRRLMLYPTRGIRRKNMGELLLLGAVCGDRWEFASTLGPENPEWQSIHSRWIALAKRRRLPVHLALGERNGVEFADLVACADAFVTTSVAEGFGLAFLEPWLAGKSVCGRNLPEITGDFAANGIHLDSLYQRLEIPVSWVGEKALRDKLDQGLARSYASYGRSLPGNAGVRAFETATIDGKVDFGRLDEDLQEIAIAKALARPDGIERPILALAPSDVRTENASAVAAHYGIESYGRRLGEIYRRILAEPLSAPGALDAGALLHAFLDPRRFFLLRA